MTTYVYHYCASFQREDTSSAQRAFGPIERSDGIIVRKSPVTEFFHYEEAKAAVAELRGWPADGFTLDSFSFLHQTED